MSGAEVSRWQSENVVCAVCERESSQAVVPSNPAGGAPDMDTRPGEPLRSTLAAWVQQCPYCGYAADQITGAAAGVAEIVASEEFRGLVNGEGYPAQARRFLCYSYVLGQLGLFPDAGWCALHAAWMCDDLQRPDVARICRGQALEFWKSGKALGAGFMDTHAEEFTVVADLLRRIGDFEAARQTCNAALDGSQLPAVLEAMLRHQLVLIARQDDSVHSLQEISLPPAGAERLEL